MSDSSGLTTISKLTELIDNGVLHHVKMQWGKSERNGFIVDGKKHQYNFKNISKQLEIKINSLYIVMVGKRLNKKTTINNSNDDNVSNNQIPIKINKPKTDFTEKNKYVRTFIEQLKQMKNKEIDKVDVDLKII